MRTFIVTAGPHPPMLAIQADDLTKDEYVLVRGIATNQDIFSTDYRVRKAAGVFLQGYKEPHTEHGNDGWILIEFWSDDREAITDFRNYLNAACN